MKRALLLSLAVLLLAPAMASAGPARRWRERVDVRREWRPAVHARQRALAQVRRARTLERAGERWLANERRAVFNSIRREYREVVGTARRTSRKVLRQFRQ